MSITALPQDTVRAVRSAPVLFDSCSVVKELIDNGLDAGATSISVEVSANTLDIIQVKDNGTGIHPEDRHLVCKRSCTSKLRSIDDLKSIGGSTLGFRGEALASAAEMSNGVLITTRTEGEVAGAALKYDRAGLLVSCNKASHPRGTTVRVSGFLNFVPVRKQTALKCTAKTLGRLKRILNAYALPRPETRLSFKVLKSKNDSSWVYASKANATVSDAMLRVVGPEATSQCTILTWPRAQNESNECDRSSIQFVASLPNPDSDFSKINHTGQYVSIDRRPMTTCQGVAKDLVKLFKSYLRSGSHCDGNITMPADTFFFLHVYCPPGSYDINVEPSKDDVLFENLEQVMSLAEDLFRFLYGEIKLNGTSHGKCPLGRQAVDSGSINPPENPPGATTEANKAKEPQLFRKILTHAAQDRRPVDNPSTTPCLWKNGSVSVGISPETVTNSRLVDENPLSTDPRPTDPWTLAKKHYVTPRKQITQSHNTNFSLLSPTHEGEPSLDEGTLTRNGERGPMQPSQPYPSPISTQVSKIRKSRVSEPRNLRIATESAAQRRELGEVGSLDVWIRKTRGPASQLTQECHDSGMLQDRESSEDAGSALTNDAIASRFGREDHVVAERNQEPSPAGLPLCAVPNNSAIETGSSLNEMQNESRTIATSLETEDNQDSRIRRPINSHLSPESQEAMAEALDFEHRKRAAIRFHRRYHGQPLSPKTSLSPNEASGAQIFQSSPYQNRYIRAKSAPARRLRGGESSQCVTALPPSDIEPGDPEANSMHNKNASPQNTATPVSPRSRRILNSRLPLESVPKAFEIQGLAVTTQIKGDEESTILNTLLETDEYVRAGIISPSPAFVGVQSKEVIQWTTRLLTLIYGQYRSEDPEVNDTAVQLVFDSVQISHA
ncbi:hypothetical protein AJ79_02898 [Helicocarpus griseus UAMH5409]|uniref:DNA mismatch repair protein S5 domain-containing protein n=1 Tax=Helicocarpus griseus UAMH5409 TaxID=1447875 RepID=A0A2B7Y1I9_9EURO|nr:hypothetical protein AJ79_02898 [Helicocarpus griseus UAMH5409]